MQTLRFCTDSANQDYQGIGIEKVRIMSSRLFEQLQAQFRDGLQLDGEAFRSEVAMREEKQLKQSGLADLGKQLEIGLARSEAALLEARVAVSHRQAALDAERLGTERLEREMHQAWSREQLVSEIVTVLKTVDLGAILQGDVWHSPIRGGIIHP